MTHTTVDAATISRAREIIGDSPALASPPVVYDRLMRVIADPHSGAAEVAHTIATDQALTARLLRLVNSSLYSLVRPVDTVTGAVRVVGTSQVRDLALATSILSLFEDVPVDLVDLRGFWHHSLGVAVTARVLAQRRGDANTERCLVAGLIHDIGRLVMLMNAPKPMSNALAEASASGGDLARFELEHVGATHMTVGGELLRKWNFPSYLEESVRYHHDPAEAKRFPAEAAAVHVADVIANALRWGYSGRLEVPQLDARAWDILQIAPDDVPSIIEESELHLLATLQVMAV